MSSHEPRRTHSPAPATSHESSDDAPPVVRSCDVVVVGGSAAGLAAALQLARQRRSVIVVDDGTPRNATSPHLHGFLGHDGRAPAEFIAAARAEVRGYGVEVLTGRVVDATRDDEPGSDGSGLSVSLESGHVVTGRRLVIATGVADELPDIEGLVDGWGRDVIHCPFCHGFEARDRRLVQIVDHPAGLHATVLLQHLSGSLTVVANESVRIDDAEQTRLEAVGVSVVTGTVRRVVRDDAGGLRAVELDDDRRLEVDVVAVGPRFRARLDAFAGLGLRAEEHTSGLGDHVATDATGATSAAGVYAVGNVTEPGAQLSQAASDGARAGAMIAFDLADEELRGADTPAANAVDWDRRYSGDRLWSGNPNGSVVREVAALDVGRALDVGAGEGGDACWLAEQGWQVTASDVSANALARVAAEADRRGLDVATRLADATVLDAFGGDRFDLVTASYASLPRSPDHRAIHNLIDAVAAGGILVAVGHDLSWMADAAASGATASSATRGHGDGHDDRPGHGDGHEHDGELGHGDGHSAPRSIIHDPGAYVGVDDIASVLADDPEWTIEVHETRPRPAGAASQAHHVDDVVLRAHRNRS